MRTQTGNRRRGRRAGVRSNEAGKEKRERLLDAAEQLFAHHGVDAVSVRDITETAEANTASIHYHFGSKLELVTAILERRGGMLGQRRDELLDELEKRSTTELRDLVEALVRPTAEMVAESEGGRNYIAFLSVLGNHPEFMPVIMQLHDHYTDRFLTALAKITPDLPDDVRVLRFAVSKDLINRVLGQPDGQIRLWVKNRNPGADEFIIDGVIDMVVGVFQAPVSEPRFDRVVG